MGAAILKESAIYPEVLVLLALTDIGCRYFSCFKEILVGLSQNFNLSTKKFQW
jgi:hypothetical protein